MYRLLEQSLVSVTLNYFNFCKLAAAVYIMHSVTLNRTGSVTSLEVYAGSV